ncbi:hypothetical protein HK099_002060, partial [Clydaea vesicula]
MLQFDINLIDPNLILALLVVLVLVEVCNRTLILSRGAVAVRETSPEIPPAKKYFSLDIVSSDNKKIPCESPLNKLSKSKAKSSAKIDLKIDFTLFSLSDFFRF